MRDVFKYLDLLKDGFFLLLWTHFELLVRLYDTWHIVSFSIGFSYLGKCSFTDNLIEDVILVVDCFGIFNRWKFENFIILQVRFDLRDGILWFVGSELFINIIDGIFSFDRIGDLSSFSEFHLFSNLLSVFSYNNFLYFIRFRRIILWS